LSTKLLALKHFFSTFDTRGLKVLVFLQICCSFLVAIVLTRLFASRTELTKNTLVGSFQELFWLESLQMLILQR